MPKDGVEKSMWIAAHLTGGLGNRLFQLSAALGLSEKWKKDTVFFLPKCGPTNHGPFDTLFRMFPQIPIVETASEWELLEEAKGDLYTYHPFADTPITNLPTIVHGFRQSPLYFPTTGVQAHLHELLDSKRWSMLLTKYDLTRQDQKEKTFFLHVRLGDYLLLPHHQVNLQHYYIQCLSKIPQRSRVLFFSDEPERVKEIFQHIVQALGHSFQATNESDELESLSLMSQCWGGAITANSTFSWWGAYFGKTRCSNTDAFLAFYPDTWGAGLPVPKDIVPSWGTTISVE
jgi:hypothetical protein